MPTKTARQPVIKAKEALLEALINYVVATGDKVVPYRDCSDLCAVLDEAFNDFEDAHLTRAIAALQRDATIECEPLKSDIDGQMSYTITLLINP